MSQSEHRSKVGEIFKFYNKELIRFAHHLLGRDKTVAEDLIADVFHVMLSGKIELPQKPIDQIRAFLYTIVRRRVADQIRTKSTFYKVFRSFNDQENMFDHGVYKRLIDYEDPSSILNHELLRQEYGKAIDLLDEHVKEAYVLDIQGLSNKEISEVTGMDVFSVKNQLHKARLQIREKVSYLFEDHERNRERQSG